MSEELGELVNLFAKNGIAEFEHEENGKKLKIKCRTTTKPSEKPNLKQEKPEEKIKEQTKEQAMPQENQFYILESTQVGYFHIFPQKTVGEIREPFVKIGARVNLDTILGTVECMKIQNEIKLANYKDFPGNYGIIEDILENECTPVDYGKPLFQIRHVKEIEYSLNPQSLHLPIDSLPAF